MISVEVCYASETEQLILAVQVPQNCTVMRAIFLSNLLDRFPEINLQESKVGIFGQKVDLLQVLREGDRVEIYRALKIDPKQARRLR